MARKWALRSIVLGVLLSSGSARALDPSQAAWTLIGGGMRVGPNSLVAAGSAVWAIVGTRLFFFNHASHVWVATNGSSDAGTQLSIGGNGTLWVSLNSAGVLWSTPASACPPWGTCSWSNAVRPSFTISTLSAGDGVHPWVINSAGTGLFRWDGSQFQTIFNANWPGFAAGATLTQVAVGTDDDAWALDSNGTVLHRTSTGWATANPRTGSLIKVNVNVTSLSVTDASTVWAASTTTSGLFNFRQPNRYFPTQSPWEQQCVAGCTSNDSTFSSVTARRNPVTGLLDVWGLRTTGTSIGNIYHVDQTRTFGFNDTSSTMQAHVSLVNVAGTLSQLVTAGPGSVWGNQSNGNLFSLPGNWLQFGGDSTHAGNNGLEANLGPTKMGSLVPKPGFTSLPFRTRRPCSRPTSRRLRAFAMSRS